MPKNAVPSYESKFFIDEYGLSGIRDWEASYSVPQQTINAFGAGFVRNVYNGPLQGNLSFTRDMIFNSDPVLSYTGDAALSGTLIYDTYLDKGTEKVFGFTEGYLTNYSVRCGVGDVPTVDSSFVSFGRFGSGIRGGDLDFSGNKHLDTSRGAVVGFANQGSIRCSFGQSATNRVTQVSQSYGIEREPVYTLNQKSFSDLTGGAGFTPAEVITHYPVEVTTNMTVEVDDFETANIMDTIRSGHYETIDVKVDQHYKGSQDLDGNRVIPATTGTLFLADSFGNSLKDNGTTTMYNFHSITGQLVSESIDTSTDGVLSVNLEFKDYLNRNL